MDNERNDTDTNETATSGPGPYARLLALIQAQDAARDVLTQQREDAAVAEPTMTNESDTKGSE